jgi:isopropylmalate/homocitrate/citramalate synthase
VKGIEGVTISVHGHDDLGMAVANFMAAIEGTNTHTRRLLS